MSPRQDRPPRAPRGHGRNAGRRDAVGDILLGLLRPKSLQWIAILVIAILGAIGFLPPGEIRGPAKVIDGDSLMINGTDEVRLYGIDAPELDQSCDNGEACGRRAMAHLAKLIGSNTLVCDKHGTDRYGRDVAQCFLAERDASGETVHGADIGRAMVRDGHAMAYRDITKLYVPDEPDHFDFAPPWEWRERHSIDERK